MSLLALLCLSGFLINLAIASSNVCKVVTVNNSIFQNGKRLQGFQFYRSTFVPDVFQCARMCFFRRRCLSFNYNQQIRLCEFNNARVDPPYVILNTSNDYRYSDIDDWDKEIGMGPCQNQPCGICEACYPTEFKYTCVKEELTSCRDIKICTRTSTDGHYLVRPMMGTKPWLKVYCYDMKSKYPREYITLIHDNFSKYPPLHYLHCTSIDWVRRNPGVIFYHKIRLELITFRVMVNDRTFTNVSCDPSLLGISDPLSFNNSGTNCTVQLNYAKAGDCIYHTCPRKGVVHLDLQGTGLIFSPSVKWISSGYKSGIDTFYRSPSNEVIKAVCGGNCGWCYPKGDLILEPKS